MIEEINFCDFCNRFESMDRKENFSYEGKQALFDYLENYEEETETKINLDVISLCCGYTEYEDIKDFKKNYGSDQYQTIEDIENETTVIRIENKKSFIVQNF